MNADEKKILSRIGEPVVYTYPGREGKRLGVLRDRYVMPTSRDSTRIRYWQIVDLIEFSGYREFWIRIGYFRKANDRLVFAGQTTSTHRKSQWRRLLVQAAIEKRWFRKLLEDVAQDLKR